MQHFKSSSIMRCWSFVIRLLVRGCSLGTLRMQQFNAMHPTNQQIAQQDDGIKQIEDGKDLEF